MFVINCSSNKVTAAVFVYDDDSVKRFPISTVAKMVSYYSSCIISFPQLQTTPIFFSLLNILPQFETLIHKQLLLISIICYERKIFNVIICMLSMNFFDFERRWILKNVFSSLNPFIDVYVGWMETNDQLIWRTKL